MEAKMQFPKCWPPKDATSDAKKEVRHGKTMTAKRACKQF